MAAVEANFDGIVGPTHNYAGLSTGNTASVRNLGEVARPREAALQGLAKMRALADLGFPQGVLPPHERPHIPTLRSLGFSGSDTDIVARTARKAPHLLAQVSSGSAMWTANAATVAPSADTDDDRVHFTPANLRAKFHRSLEPPVTGSALAATFRDDRHFVVHGALPGGEQFGDEGAANHTRLCRDYSEPGAQIFVYGRSALDPTVPAPSRYPARQTLEASRAVARLHGLDPARTHFAQQNPAVIDAGVFHNDVISVGDRGVLLYHEDAFVDPEALLEFGARILGDAFVPICVDRARVPVADAVDSYLFNTQLLAAPDGNGTVIIAPQECRETATVHAFLRAELADSASPITAVEYFDLRQSMKNGGGPACLRLRVVLTDAERAVVNPGSWIDPARHAALVDWVDTHYREELSAADLADPQLLGETREALDALTTLLGLGSIYEFQRSGA